MLLTVGAVLVALGSGLVVAALAATRRRSLAPAGDVVPAVGLVGDEAGAGPGLLARAVEPLLAGGASVVRRLSPARRLDLTRRRLVYAGLDGTVTVQRILSYKAAATVGGTAFGLLGGPGAVPRLVWALGLGLLCSFVPDVMLDARARARQQAIARDLPESLDLLALTVEAGLGLEQAMAVVIDNSDGPLAGELARLLREVELGVPRREALGSLRARTCVPELSSFVVALVQADQMGVAVAAVLKTQAGQVRLRRQQRAREQAAKTPVKILFPVVLGVFPAIFVVALGPAAINIARELRF